MTVQGDAPAQPDAPPPPAAPLQPLVREVEQLPDGRRITYYSRATRTGPS
jgi:hypothetical protein